MTDHVFPPAEQAAFDLAAVISNAKPDGDLTDRSLGRFQDGNRVPKSSSSASSRRF
jgi:hypothetical protein